MLRVKGADVTVWLKFMCNKLSEKQCDDLDSCAAFSTCIWAMDRFLTITMNGGIFLTAEESDEIHQLGMLYLHTYIALAAESLEAGKLYWKVRPKLHLFWHLAHKAKHSKGRRNPHNDSNWMDEDFIKHMTQLMSKTHNLTGNLRALERYLLGLPAKLAKTCKK